MSHIYVTSSSVQIGIEGGRIIIKNKDGIIRSIPRETVESISIFGRTGLSTAAIQFLLEKGLPVNFFSSKGKYFGRLESMNKGKEKIIKQQISVFENEEYSIELSRKIVSCKIRNQEVVLRRYIKTMSPELQRNIDLMKFYRGKAETGSFVEQIIGYEGIAAKIYFDSLSMIIEPSFAFKGRSKRPPKDEFNSLLSMGYTLLLYEIYSMIQNEGMHPFYGIMHKSYSDNPALASDLMEEWRSIIVDSTVLSMIQGHEVSVDDFYREEGEEGVFIQNEALNKFINKFEKKLNSSCSYLVYDDRNRTMREALQEQCRKLRESIISNKQEVYVPVIIR